MLLVWRLHTDKGKKTDFSLNALLASRIGSGQSRGSKQFIHLLKGATFGFGHEEYNIEHSDGRDTPEENERAEVAFLKERRRRGADRKVVQL